MTSASAVDKSVHTTDTFFLTSVGVTHVELISSGTVNGTTVYGIAFNKLTPELTSLSATTTTLSAFNGTKFVVNNAYDAKTMALILQDWSTYEFVVDISKAQTASQSLTASWSNVPEINRLHRIEML